jgi:hypothetical protein
LFQTKKQSEKKEISEQQRVNDFYKYLADEIYKKFHGITTGDLPKHIDSNNIAFIDSSRFPIKKEYFISEVNEIISSMQVSGEYEDEIKLNILIYTQPTLI